MEPESRFERVLERDILKETYSECKVRQWQENLAKPVVYLPEDIERMKFFLDRDEKKAAEDHRIQAELKAAYYALSA